MTTLNTPMVQPTTAQLDALRVAGWGYHLRYMRGTVEVLGQPGEVYTFTLTADGMSNLQHFIENLPPASVRAREIWEHRAVMAGVNDVEGMSTEQLQAAVAGGAR